MVNRNNTVKLVLAEEWLLDPNLIMTILRIITFMAQVGNNGARELTGMLLVEGDVITNPRLLRM